MREDILFQKAWQDNELIELSVVCSSPVVTTRSQIYVTDGLLDKLSDQIERFLAGKIPEGAWANETKGNASTACLALRFLKKNRLGHILIEVFVELDDGGDYAAHNCCFFINTEYGALMDFGKNLTRLKKGSVGCEIRLKDESH